MPPSGPRPAAEIGHAREARRIAGVGGGAADQEDVVDEPGERVELAFADGAAADRQAALVGTVQPRGAAAGQDRRAGASGEGRRRHVGSGLVGSGRGRVHPARRRRSAR